MELETFDTEDMMRIFRLSRPGFYRRLRDAREGRGGLPLPIPAGPKQRLRWNVETVRKFLDNTDNMPSMPLSLPTESAAKRAARNRAAMKELEKFGIKIKEKESEK